MLTPKIPISILFHLGWKEIPSFFTPKTYPPQVPDGGFRHQSPKSVTECPHRSYYLRCP